MVAEPKRRSARTIAHVEPSPGRLPAELRPAPAPPAAVGATGQLLHRHLGADRAARAVDRTAMRLERRPTDFGGALCVAKSAILPLLDEAQPAAHRDEAEWRLRQLPALDQLVEAEVVIHDALTEEPASAAMIRVLVTAMLGIRANVRLDEKEAYIDGLVFTVWDDQERERYTAPIIASAVNFVAKTRTWLPEIAEFIDALHGRRAAMLEAQARTFRLKDLYWNARSVIGACSPLPPEADDEPMPF